MDFFNGITVSILFLYIIVGTISILPGYLACKAPSYVSTSTPLVVMSLSSAAGTIYRIIFLILFSMDFTFLSACALGVIGHILSSLALAFVIIVFERIRWLLGFVFSFIWPIFAFLLTIELPMFK